MQLPYGDTHIKLKLNEEDKVHILRPKTDEYQPKGHEKEIVRKALDNPISSFPLKELAKGKKNIVIISSDHTRPVPSKITIPILIDEIKSSNPKAKITILISTGMHRPSTDKELKEKFGREVLDQVKIVNHRAEANDEMTYLGTLPSGGEFWINSISTDADLLIGEGFIEPHFFAGFSGGRKSVLPGIASRKTVLFNHNAEFIADKHARTGILEDNPIQRDMIWAAEQSKMAFILNVVINSQKKSYMPYQDIP